MLLKKKIKMILRTILVDWYFRSSVPKRTYAKIRIRFNMFLEFFSTGKLSWDKTMLDLMKKIDKAKNRKEALYILHDYKFSNQWWEELFKQNV